MLDVLQRIRTSDPDLLFGLFSNLANVLQDSCASFRRGSTNPNKS